MRIMTITILLLFLFSIILGAFYVAPMVVCITMAITDNWLIGNRGSFKLIILSLVPIYNWALSNQYL